MDEPDDLELVGVSHKYLDGSSDEQIQGFRKTVTVTVPPLTTATDRRFMAKFILADVKALEYGNFVSQVVNVDEQMSSRWVNDCEQGRMFILRFTDVHVYHAWDDGVISDDLMYLKRDVEITGTVTTPQTLTTNSDALVVMENGNPFPSFNASTHDFLIAVNAEKGCEASFGVVKGSVSVIAGNLTFDIFVSDFGQTAADGKYYCSIAIFLQAK
jgi:hypothetical protein